VGRIAPEKDEIFDANQGPLFSDKALGGNPKFVIIIGIGGRVVGRKTRMEKNFLMKNKFSRS